MSLIFLVGRHGAGKSTVGAELVKVGYKHISVGLLRRLARAHQAPSDIPYALMSAMRRTQPGAAMPNDVARKIVAYALQFERCVVDGFPASVMHLELVPPDATVAVVCTPKTTRHARLAKRAETSRRQWVEGRRSEREESLAGLIAKARYHFSTLYVKNDGAAHLAALQLLKRIGKG